MKNIKIFEFKEIEEIINKAEICHMAMVDGDKPYVLPFNYGYKDKTIYLHSGPGGKKFDVLKKNNNVSLSFETDSVLNIRNEYVACSYSMKFKSVLVTGKVEFIEEPEKKVEALNIIMKQYCGRDDFKYNAPAIKNVVVFKITDAEFTGRRRGYEE